MTPQEEKEFDEKFKCINSQCDSNGTISAHGCNGTEEDCARKCPVAEQCQFCHEYLLPLKSHINQLLEKRDRELVEMVKKLDVPEGDIACDYGDHVDKNQVLSLLTNDKNK